MSTTSQQAVTASVSARARTNRGQCPSCGKQSVVRVVMPITAPLLLVGHCRISCGKCRYSDVTETRKWEAAS